MRQLVRWWGALGALLAFAAGALAAEEATPPLIRREFGVDTGAYSLRIARDGMLQDFYRNDEFVQKDKEGKEVKRYPAPRTLLFKRFVFGPYNLNADAPLLTDLTQTGANEFTLAFGSNIREGRERTGPATLMPAAYQVRYVFRETEVEATIKTKHPWQFGFELGPEAQVAQSTSDLVEVALPRPPRMSYGRHQSWRFTYSEGSELLYRYQGPGMEFGYHGGIGGQSGLEWNRQLAQPNCDFVFTFRLLPGKERQKVVASPVFEASTPHTAHVFFEGEDKKFRLTFLKRDYQKVIDNAITPVEIVYWITDPTGKELTRGKAPIDFAKEGLEDPKEGRIVKEVTIPLARRGYFDAWFQVSDPGKRLKPIPVKRKFTVLEPLAPIAKEREEGLGDWRGDYRRQAFIGLGLVRENLTGKIWDPQRKSGTYEPATGTYHWEELDRYFTNAREQSNKTGIPFHMMLMGAEWAKTPKDHYEFYKALVTRYKDRCTAWETINEPTITMRPQEYLEQQLIPLYTAAKEADPTCTVIGICSCGWAYEWIEEVLKLGGAKYMDALSIHPYQGTPYDQTFIPCYEKLRALMARYNMANVPVWLTEGGFNWDNENALDRQVDCAKNMVRRILIQDQYGIPKERDLYYYTSATGYHRFYVVDFDGSLFPQGAATRNLKCRLASAKFARALPFAVPFIKGSVYTTAENQIVPLWTFDNTRDLQVKSDATTAQLYDMWGNTTALTAKDGAFTVRLGGEPVFLVLPLAAKLEPVQQPLTYNVAQLTLGAEASASTEGQPAALALDGIWDGGGWRDATRHEFPDWWQVELPYPQAVNRVILSTGGALKDFVVQAQVNDQWQTLHTVKESRDHILDLNFPVVTTSKLRVEVTAVNGWGESWIRECQVFAAAGQATEMVNWADAFNGGKATASSSWKLGEADYQPSHAIDGKHVAGDWRDYVRTTWIDGTPGQFPDWLQVDFAGPRKLSSVVVFVNNFQVWRPAATCISDCELQVWDGKDWQAAGSVTGNTKGVIAYVLKTPVETSKIRLLVKAANDQKTATIMEVEAWGPKP